MRRGSLFLVLVVSLAILPLGVSSWALPMRDFDNYERKALKAETGWGGEEFPKSDRVEWSYKQGHAGWLFDKHWKHDVHSKDFGKNDDPYCDPPVSTPEPATILLVGTTLTGLGLVRRRIYRH